MKELTIEEKAKAYDRAIANAKEQAIDGYLDAVAVNDIFPELAESKDERIRKELIAAFQNGVTYNQISKTRAKDYIAWLEKQGGQKPYGLREECKDCQCNYAGECKGSCAMKRNEQNPIKVPKFKVGDFIQFNGMWHTRYTIKEVCGLSHYVNTCDKRMDMSYTDANFELVEHSAWSEEDERQYRAAIAICNSLGHTNTADWLKSLRPQKQWKPSEAQVVVVDDIIRNGHLSNANERIMCGLLEQLKKLKE